MPKRFEKTPATGTPDLWDGLARFRATHPPKRLDVAGIHWTYMVCGRGEQVVVMLVGALGDADPAFQHITALETEYRVIVPNYPTVTTMTACLDGLIGIIENSGGALRTNDLDIFGR